MNEFPAPQFYGGSGEPPYVPPVPPPPPPPRVRPPERRDRSGGGTSRGFLLLLLFLACALLGVFLSWGIKQYDQRAALSRRNVDLQNAYVAVLADRSSLATLLIDSRTKLFALAGRGDTAGRSVTVAWQESTRGGVLIGDAMPLPPDDAAYVLWHVDGGGAATPCAKFRPDPAGTIQSFHMVPPAADGTAGFRVTVEHDGSPAAPGPVAYETR